MLSSSVSSVVLWHRLRFYNFWNCEAMILAADFYNYMLFVVTNVQFLAMYLLSLGEVTVSALVSLLCILCNKG